MSLNTAHADNGVLIHSGECILLYSDQVSVEFSGQESADFRGTKTGRMYLTTHRMIFNSKSSSESMRSFSFPFVSLSDVGVEQPMFGANYIKGKVRAQPNGNWIGESKFKLTFKSGGAIEFGQAMLKAAHMATRGMRENDSPPPYTPPSGPWYAAPPPAYQAAPQGYYGWVPPVDAFPNPPPPNSVFMSSAPPPYPGINMGPYQGGFASPQGYPGSPQGYAGAPAPGYQGPPAPGYQGAPAPGYQGGPAPGYPGSPPQGYPGAPSNYPGQQPGFQAPPTGFPAPQQGGFGGPQPGYPGVAQTQPYPGASAPSAPSGGFNDAKAAEAAQSAYYDPNKPQMAYVPPPAYYEQPPSYQQSMSKKDQ